MFRPRGGMMRHHARRQPGMATGLLLAQMFNVGFDRIPPVTLASIAAQVVIFLGLVKLPFGGLQQVCVSAHHVWFIGDWKRLVLAAIYHGDEWHLYFNMVSLLWKGKNLERRLGSKYFAYMLAVFTLLSNALMVAMAVFLDEFFGSYFYTRQCAVGFSGVLFALKVVAAHSGPPSTNLILGFIPVPSRLACWAELLLIHIMVPNASFLGHLAGILVGLLYIQGPLKFIMDIPVNAYAEPSYTYRQDQSGFRGQAYTTGHHSNHMPSGHNTRHQNNSYTSYTGGLSEEEQIAQAMQNSMRAEPSAPPYHDARNSAPYPSHPGYGGMPTPPVPDYPSAPESSSHLYPDLSSMHDNEANEEIRRRRLQRFSH